MDESPKQVGVLPGRDTEATPPVGFSPVCLLGRLTAGLVLAGGVAGGLLLLDHFARTSEGLQPLDWAWVIGVMGTGVAGGAILWLLSEILTQHIRLARVLELQHIVKKEVAEQNQPSIERLQAAIDDLRELVLLDEESKVAHRSAKDELVRERAELRTRLYADLQTAAGAKNWTEAVRLSEQLLAEYPYSLEAQTVAGKLPTLRANAEIAHRQEMEQGIKTLVHDQKYPEAVALARQLIGQYPDSPQAKALVVQLPRLEQLAAIALAIANGTLIPVVPPGGAAPAGVPVGEPVNPQPSERPV